MKNSCMSRGFFFCLLVIVQSFVSLGFFAENCKKKKRQSRIAYQQIIKLIRGNGLMLFPVFHRQHIAFESADYVGQFEHGDVFYFHITESCEKFHL